MSPLDVDVTRASAEAGAALREHDAAPTAARWARYEEARSKLAQAEHLAARAAERTAAEQRAAALARLEEIDRALKGSALADRCAPTAVEIAEVIAVEVAPRLASLLGEITRAQAMAREAHLLYRQLGEDRHYNGFPAPATAMRVVGEHIGRALAQAGLADIDLRDWMPSELAKPARRREECASIAAVDAADAAE